jgi:hypothetical protein
MSSKRTRRSRCSAASAAANSISRRQASGAGPQRQRDARPGVRHPRASPGPQNHAVDSPPSSGASRGARSSASVARLRAARASPSCRASSPGRQVARVGRTTEPRLLQLAAAAAGCRRRPRGRPPQARWCRPGRAARVDRRRGAPSPARSRANSPAAAHDTPMASAARRLSVSKLRQPGGRSAPAVRAARWWNSVQRAHVSRCTRPQGRAAAARGGAPGPGSFTDSRSPGQRPRGARLHSRTVLQAPARRVKVLASTRSGGRRSQQRDERCVSRQVFPVPAEARMARAAPLILVLARLVSPCRTRDRVAASEPRHAPEPSSSNSRAGCAARGAPRRAARAPGASPPRETSRAAPRAEARRSPTGRATLRPAASPEQRPASSGEQGGSLASARRCIAAGSRRPRWSCSR